MGIKSFLCAPRKKGLDKDLRKTFNFFSVNLQAMCGIAAIVAFTEKGKERLGRITSCADLLRHRGPDNQQHFTEEDFAMAHARLSIIDLSAQSDQPLTSFDKRFTAVFNGEIFNYKTLREELKKKGRTFQTEGDLEVLLNLYAEYGPECLHKIRGFFAFVIYDRQKKIFFVARDRFGVKPLYFYSDRDYFACSSEMRPLKFITDQKNIDRSALFTYLQLTYTPEQISVLENIHKLQPGHFALIENGQVKVQQYYSVKLPASYRHSEDPGKKFLELLENALEDRMVSDVPVGSFLSGGIDSSVITALASKRDQQLKTFSVGFKGDSHFDESKYAEIVAKKYKTDHHTFYFTEEEAEAQIEDFFNGIDEPFADSSAFNVFLLSKKTKEYVKVVLSGDGADELFAGYNKHRAEWMIRHQRMKTLLVKNSAMLASIIPTSRDSNMANKARQLQRFASGARLSAPERYWRWACFYEEKKAARLLKLNTVEHGKSQELKQNYIQSITDDLNTVLLTDVNLVLVSDMLVKVDRMSMAHGLEVRNPFLDHNLVEFAFSLEARHKIDPRMQKKIVKESCAHLLPAEILHRKKHGFETPVHKWLQGVLRKKVDELLLDKNFINQQGLFNYEELQRVVKSSLSANAGDTTAVVWSLLVFNHWYKKHIS